MISVVIPAYNALDTIGDCLDSLANQTLSNSLYEVIVVDDGSTDGTKELVKASGVQLIEQERQRPAAARNAGIQAAKGDIICFTDADCAPAPNWLETLTAPFTDPNVAGTKGIYGTHQPEITARFVQIEYEDKYDLLRPLPKIDFIDTYSAAYKRDVLIGNNCFDPTFPYLEDQELSFRLAARGYDMRFQPDAMVYHRHAASPRAYLRKKFVIGYWKAQVVRRFPDRGVKDSHTPQVMKVQMGLMALLLAGNAGILTTTLLLPQLTTLTSLLTLLIALIFIASTIPFAKKAWHKDRTVALVSPLWLGIRALGLGVGYGWGIVNPASGITGQESTIGGLSYVGKRALDILGGLVGMGITLLCYPFIALAIKRNSPGNVLFTQERIGQGGDPFTIYKFRSMNPNAEAELHDLVDINALAQPAFKLKNDPRITPVGRTLRRWSLDELPQFWNVLTGDMSLIGPRPEEAKLVAKYNDWHRRRLSVKPGMSGPMQVNGRGDLPLDERVRLELDYIENYSLWQDVKFILQTIPAVWRGDGAR